MRASVPCVCVCVCVYVLLFCPASLTRCIITLQHNSPPPPPPPPSSSSSSSSSSFKTLVFEVQDRPGADRNRGSGFLLAAGLGARCRGTKPSTGSFSSAVSLLLPTMSNTRSHSFAFLNVVVSACWPCQYLSGMLEDVGLKVVYGFVGTLQGFIPFQVWMKQTAKRREAKRRERERESERERVCVCARVHVFASSLPLPPPSPSLLISLSINLPPFHVNNCRACWLKAVTSRCTTWTS